MFLTPVWPPKYKLLQILKHQAEFISGVAKKFATLFYHAVLYNVALYLVLKRPLGFQGLAASCSAAMAGF